METFEIKKELSYVLNKPLASLNDKERDYKRAYCRFRYKEKLSKMTPEELTLFRQKSNEAGKRFYNGRKKDHLLVLLLKEELLD